MGGSYVEPGDSDDGSSDYHNGLDSEEEAFWKSIALKEEKDFEDAQTDQVAGGAVAQEETNFRSRYPDLATYNHRHARLTILDNNSAQEELDGINLCQCCDRHQVNRPNTIGGTPLRSIPSNHTEDEREDFRDECDCPCRSYARDICRRMHGND